MAGQLSGIIAVFVGIALMPVGHLYGLVVYQALCDWREISLDILLELFVRNVSHGIPRSVRFEALNL